MAIQISRVFTRETGATSSSVHPNLVGGSASASFEVVIESQTDRPVSTIYQVFIEALDLSTGLNVPGLSPAITPPGTVEVVNSFNGWGPTPAGQERARAYPVTVPPGFSKDLFKYFVALVTVSTPVEAATAESELFIIA